MNRIQTCFSTLGCPERSLDEVIALAKTYGIGALEIRGLNGTMKNAEIADFSSDRAEETKRKLTDAGLRFAVLGTSAAFHDPEKYEAAIREGEEAIGIAARLGFLGIRVFGNGIKGEERDCTARVIRGISHLCRAASGTGVQILLETHGDYNTKARLSTVAEACGSYDNFGLIWDVCHTRKTYGADWRDFCTDFFPFIRHVHLKDVAGDTLVRLGEGDLPLAEMVCALSALGYRGAFSLEWEKKWHPELPEIETALADFARLFGA